MINIHVDTSQINTEFSLSKRESEGMVSYIIKELCVRFARAWADEAKRELGQTRQEYLRSLIVGEEGKFVGFVMLVGAMPNMMEGGANPFDMKVGFLRSPKAKYTDKAVYMSIPFRFATPGTVAESTVFSGILPEELYNVAKNLAPALTTPGAGKVMSGGSLAFKDLPEEFQVKAIRPRIVAENRVFEEYKHKTSIYAGLQKATKTYERATTGNYITFRRVSSIGSDPNSWVHKGIVARNLAEKALGKFDVPRTVDKATDSYLSRLGF